MNTRRAFTLVEVLTVVVIISILAALVTLAVAGAMSAAKRGRITMEMSQVAMALEHYKAEFGEYPPDMFDDEALVRHVKKRWPRLVLSGVNDADFIRTAISTAYGNGVDFTQANSQVGALALWLGGFPNSDGKFSGFFADPENPFIPSVPVAFDNKNFGDLELGKNVRIVNFDSCFVPIIGNEIRDVFVPIVYFRGLSSGGHRAYMITDENHAKSGQVKQFDFRYADLGFCVPYAEDENGGVTKWKNPTTYQLIHPGLDGKFGEPAPGNPTVAPLRIIKSGANIGADDLDNLTNFSDNKELKSILP